MLPRAIRTLAYAAIVAAAFLGWVYPQTLDITNVGWTLNGRDWGQNALGLASYLRSGNWPGSWTPLILAPEGVHLLMMDSNPLLGLILKPFAPLLPPGVQFIGWVLLINLALHVRFARLLVREQAPSFGNAWAGTALLTLLPTLYNRYQHSNLAAHWLILWALWLFVDRDRSRRWGQWLAVIALAGLIHNYLLLMVLAIWASAMLRGLALGDRARTLALIAGAGMLGAALIGYHGLAQLPVSTGTWGSFPMAIDALWNPGNPSYSIFLRASLYSANQGYEGFQYLGAGLLLLVAIAAVTALRGWPRRDGMIWLLPAFAGLTMLAVTDVVVFGGERLIQARPPQPVIDALDLVRASGRLFWPVAYTIVYAAIVAIYRLGRRDLILTAALILQIADIAPMLAVIRAQSAQAASPGVFRRTLDPRWQTLIARASAIDIQPPEPFRDVQLIEEIGWRAMLACRPIRYMYVSRVSRAAQARLDRERRAFLTGKIDPARLYILYPGEPVPQVAAARARVLDGVTIIVPTRGAAPPTLCRDDAQARRSTDMRRF